MLLLAIVGLAGSARSAGTQIAGPDPFTVLLDAAARGQPQAELQLADAYRYGRNVTADYLAARTWYDRAARAGLVAAATELGLLYVDLKQPAAALPWLERAARSGDARATGALATVYFNGGGIAPDRPLAYGLTARAARTGLAAARAQLALLDHYLDAREIAASADRLQRWDAAPRTPLPVAPTASPVQIPAPKTKPPVPLREARSSPDRASPWQAQLGAFHSVDAARRSWALLSRRIKFDAGTEPILTQTPTVVRLRLPAASADAAKSLCLTLHTAGEDCVALRIDLPAPPARKLALNRSPSD